MLLGTLRHFSGGKGKKGGKGKNMGTLAWSDVEMFELPRPKAMTTMLVTTVLTESSCISRRRQGVGVIMHRFQGLRECIRKGFVWFTVGAWLNAGLFDVVFNPSQEESEAALNEAL